MPTNKAEQRKFTATARQAEALKLRIAGMAFNDIANELGYQSKTGAFKAVQTGLKKTLREPADELRTMEAERLDRMLAGLWGKAITGDTWSVDRVLAIMDRRAKLLGLDKPAERDLSSEVAGFLSGVQTVKEMQVEDLSERE